MKKLFLFLWSFTLSTFVWAQGVINNGADIIIASDTYLYIDGGTNGNYIHNAGSVDLDGTMIVEGDFINTAANNNVFVNVDNDGTVRFPSGTHTITADQTNADGVINNYVNFEKVEIPTGSTVNVPSGSGITINGQLTLDGDLYLLSGSGEDPTGSLIYNQTSYSGSGSVHLYREFKVGARWQYISMPVNDATDDIFDHSPASGNFNPNLYWYDEKYNASPDPANTDYSNWTNTTYNFSQAWYNEQVADQSNAVLLEVGKGYITYNESNITHEFIAGSSALNLASSYDLSSFLSYTFNDANGGYYDGWILLGNPYQSSIDWDAINRGSGIKNTVYMWDGDNGNYVYYNNGSPDDHDQGGGQTLNNDGTARYIREFQGFFVKASSTSGLSFQIPKSAAIHTANQMYKGNNTQKPNFTYFKLRFIDNNINKYDEAIIRFWENNATWGDDISDAPKAFALYNDVPQIYSTTSLLPNAVPLAFNTLPIDYDVDFVSIPIGVVAKEDAIYTFSLVDYNNLDFSRVLLVDNTEDQIQYIDLTSQDYTVELNAGEYRGRFFLLGYYTDTPNPDPTDILYENGTNVKIYSDQKFVYISIPNVEELNGVIQIFDELGRMVYASKASSTLETIDLDVAPGSYIVKYHSPKKVYTEKVIITL